MLASEQQLRDIARFCAGDLHEQLVWGIAPHFYVTLTTFRHPFLINPRTQRNPVFIGPVFVHMRKETENYEVNRAKT